MPYLTTLVRHRSFEDTIFVDLFDVEDHVQDPEAAMRAAVKEYLQTTDGIASLKRTCHDFNWGDAVNDVTPEIWHKHGLRFRYHDQVVQVNHDEVLAPEPKAQLHVHLANNAP